MSETTTREKLDDLFTQLKTRLGVCPNCGAANTSAKKSAISTLISAVEVGSLVKAKDGFERAWNHRAHIIKDDALVSKEPLRVRCLSCETEYEPPRRPW